MLRTTKVEPRAGYRLYVEFSDGVSGEVDLAGRLFGSVFAPLKDASLFCQVRIDEFGAPCWPNGADLAPDALHQILQPRGGGHADIDFDDPRETVHLLDALVNDFQLNDERFRALHHARNYDASVHSMRQYCIGGPARFQPGGTNSQTAKRLAICLDRLRRGETWEQAIAAALEAVPK